MGSSVLSDIEKRESHLYSLASMTRDTVNILGVEQGEELHFVHGDFKIVKKILKLFGTYTDSDHFLVFKGEDVVFDHPIIGAFNEFNQTNYEKGGWEKELEQYSQAAKIIPQANNVLRYLGVIGNLDGKVWENFDNHFDEERSCGSLRIDKTSDKERHIKKLSIISSLGFKNKVVFEYTPQNYLPLHERGDWEKVLKMYERIAHRAAYRREQDIRTLTNGFNLEKLLTHHFIGV